MIEINFCISIRHAIMGAYILLEFIQEKSVAKAQVPGNPARRSRDRPGSIQTPAPKNWIEMMEEKIKTPTPVRLG